MQVLMHSVAMKAWSRPVLKRVGTIAAVAGQNGTAAQTGGGGFTTPS